MRRLNTNRTQILHRIRLKKFVPNDSLEDKYKEGKLQPDESIVIPQDDLYTISWEADFEYELFEPRKEDWADTATSLPNDATSGEADHYVTENERCSADENEQCSSEQSNESDVNDNEIRPRPAPLNESPSVTENEKDVTNESNSDENVPKRGADITVPGISENERNEENSSPRGG